MEIKNLFVEFKDKNWEIMNLTNYLFARKLDAYTYEYCQLKDEYIIDMMSKHLEYIPMDEDYERKVFAILNGSVRTTEDDWYHGYISVNDYDSDYMVSAIVEYKRNNPNVSKDIDPIQFTCQAIFEKGKLTDFNHEWCG